MKSSKHKAAAQRFVDFLTSEAGQRVLADGDSFEYPIHPGVAANPELTPLEPTAAVVVHAGELGTGLDAKKLLQEAGLI